MSDEPTLSRRETLLTGLALALGVAAPLPAALELDGFERLDAHDGRSLVR